MNFTLIALVLAATNLIGQTEPAAEPPATSLPEPEAAPAPEPEPEAAPPAPAPAVVTPPAAAAPVAAPPTGPKLTAAPGKGVTISLDDTFSLTLRGRGQVRNTFIHNGDDDTNELNIRTVRLTIQGHVLRPDLKYYLMLALGGGDFERDNPAPVYDFWVEYLGLRDLNLRVGQFFVPFDRMRTVRESTLQMVDRPLTVRELTLDRDVGIMASSTDLFGLGILAYHLFLGSGDGKNRFGGQPIGPLLVGRLVLRPFGTFDDDSEGDLSREFRPRLAVAVAGGINIDAARTNGTTGATLTAGTIDYVHGAADVVFKFAGFSLMTEAVLRRGTVDSLTTEVDGEVVEEWSRSGYGYVVQAGMMAGDHVEFTARWDQVFAWRGGTDPALHDLVASQGKQLGGGINIYLNGHALKIQSDYFFIFGRDAGQGRHMVRACLDASF